MLRALYRRARRGVLASDPGLARSRHALKTLIAVPLALELSRLFAPQTALLSAISTGFLMQCASGGKRRTQAFTMVGTGAAMAALVGLGAALHQHPMIEQALVVAAAFGAFYVRRFIPGSTASTLFTFILFLLSVFRLSGAGAAPAQMLSVAGGLCVALLVHFLVLPPDPIKAFADALRVFCAHTAELLRSLEASLRPGSPGPARRIDRDSRRLRIDAVVSQATLDASPDSLCAALSPLLRDQHEALHSLSALGRSLEALRERAAPDIHGTILALGELLERMASAFESLEHANPRLDGTGEAERGIDERGVDAFAQTALELATPPASALVHLAIAVACLRRLDAIHADLTARLPCLTLSEGRS